MASRFVIAIRGIKGKSSLLAGALDVESFHLVRDQPQSSGRSAERPDSGRLNSREAWVQRSIDGESHLVFDKLIRGEAFPSISLFEYAIEENKKPARVREIRFNEAMISSYSTARSEWDFSMNKETVGLIFASAEIIKNT